MSSGHRQSTPQYAGQWRISDDAGGALVCAASRSICRLRIKGKMWTYCVWLVCLASPIVSQRPGEAGPNFYDVAGNRRPGPVYRAPPLSSGRTRRPTSTCYSSVGKPQVI